MHSTSIYFCFCSPGRSTVSWWNFLPNSLSLFPNSINFQFRSCRAGFLWNRAECFIFDCINITCWPKRFSSISVLNISCVFCLNITCVRFLCTKLCGHNTLNGLFSFYYYYHYFFLLLLLLEISGHHSSPRVYLPWLQCLMSRYGHFRLLNLQVRPNWLANIFTYFMILTFKT